MPMLQSIIKSNPIEKFIQDNYKPEDIIAYNVHNIETSHVNGEIWETVMASSPYATPTSQLLEFVIYNSFEFNGIYFLSLEFETIINAILAEKHNTKFQNDFQIFATITETSGIRIAIKYKKHVLDEVTISFPSDKSDLYIAGTIEQAISDKILKYKTELSDENVRVLLRYATDKDKMAELIINNIPELSSTDVFNLLHVATNKDKIAEVKQVRELNGKIRDQEHEILVLRALLKKTYPLWNNEKPLL